MAHFAQLDENNIVTQVIVVNNDVILDTNGVEQESIGISFCQSLYGSDTKWRQTSYNASFRKNFAGVGSIYLEDRDMFIHAQPFYSWVLDYETGKWTAPIPAVEGYPCPTTQYWYHPTEPKSYSWNEWTKTWSEGVC